MLAALLMTPTPYAPSLSTHNERVHTHREFHPPRYLIWKKNDDTEMEVPPPAQLKNLMEAGKAGAMGEGAPSAGAAAATGGAEDAAAGLGGAASSLVRAMEEKGFRFGR